jgi:5-methylcytosine-specific restriction endonuclease McrA
MADNLIGATAPEGLVVMDPALRPVPLAPRASTPPAQRVFHATNEKRESGFTRFTVYERVIVDRAAHSSYLCANCDTRFQAGRPVPYCSLACKWQAKTVRAFRSAFDTYGRDTLPADVEQGLRIKMAMALSGGYDSAARHLPAAARQTIIERDGGRCVLCDAPGNEIDHIDGDRSNPSNLRLLCHSCHAGITLSHCDHHEDLRTDTEVDALFDQLTARIDQVTPSRACDAADWASTRRTWC